MVSSQQTTCVSASPAVSGSAMVSGGQGTMPGAVEPGGSSRGDYYQSGSYGFSPQGQQMIIIEIFRAIRVGRFTSIKAIPGYLPYSWRLLAKHLLVVRQKNDRESDFWLVYDMLSFDRPYLKVWRAQVQLPPRVF